jgi:hypothetical protein
MDKDLFLQIVNVWERLRKEFNAWSRRSDELLFGVYKCTRNSYIEQREELSSTTEKK